MRDTVSATSPHNMSQPSPTSPAYSTGQPTRSFPRESSIRGGSTDDYQHWASSATERSKLRNTTDTSLLDPPGSANSINNPSGGLTTPTQLPSSSGGGSNPQVEIFKSFRVSIDDPCHKVLPVALKKYNITADWRQYALYIVHGDQERCLGLNEKPLILFKQLDKEGRKPMFMLRKHAQPMEGHVSTVPGAGSAGRESVGGLGGGAVQIPGGVL
jgi:protein STE50